MHINWGDVPTWLAVVVAAVGGAVALRQLRQQGTVIEGEIERNKARDALLDGQLRELQDREKSHQREQAEAVDITWNDDPDGETSLVVVVNGSRRPIRLLTCYVYPDFLSMEKIRAVYGDEMYPASDRSNPRDYVFPPHTYEEATLITAIRPNGRAGFEIRKRKADCIFGTAVVRFNDDAGRRWELNSDLSLWQADDTTIPPEEISSGDETPDEPTVTS